MFIQFFFGVGFLSGFWCNLKFAWQAHIAWSMWLPSSPARSFAHLGVWRRQGMAGSQGHRKCPAVGDPWLLWIVGIYIYIFNYIVWNHVAVCGLYTLEVSTIGICLVDIAHWSMDPFWKDHLSSGGSLVRQISRIFTSLPRSLDQQNSQHHHCKWCQVRKISPYVYVYVYIYIYTHIRIYVY